MGRIANPESGQTTMFDPLDEPRLFFITIQRNLLSFLGAGMVVPAKSQFRYTEDSREIFRGAVGLWKDGIPDIATVFPQIDQERAAIIEFDFGRLEKFLEKGKVLEDKTVIVLNAPLPVSAIKTIYLKNHDAIDDFLLRLPDDVIADPDLFGFTGTGSVISVLPVYDIPEISEPVDVINFIDRFGGAIKSLDLNAPKHFSGIDYATVLCFICMNHFGFGSDASEDIQKMTQVPYDDRAIITALLDLLSGIYPEQGFDHDALLAALEEKLRGLDVQYQDSIERWLSFSRKVLNAEQDVPELDDKGDIIKRGVLLFLLRPELDRLRSSIDSSISPGSAVFSVAAFFSGFFSGMFRLGSEYKQNYSAYSRFTLNLLDAFWCSEKRKFESVNELDAVYGASLVLRINGVNLWPRRIQKNATLARVMSQAKSTGYQLDYDYEQHKLSYKADLPTGRKQTVYIELVNPLDDGKEVIRFISPCQDMSGRKKLTGPMAKEFLLRNSRDDMYCCFAISEKLEAIVVQAVQIVSTMDDDEFVMLLNEVASMADGYERDVLGKDFY